MRRTRAVVLASVVALGCSLPSAGCQTAKRAEVGVVINTPGVYRSPAGNGVA